jgi:hypothetical protein
VVDPVKELLQINVHDHATTGLHVRLRGKYRIMRTPSGTKAVAVLAKGGVKDRLQYLQQCLLDQTIHNRRDTELTLATIGLWDRYPSHRTWPVRPLQNLLANDRPRVYQFAGRLINIQTVHACCTFIGSHSLERFLQVLSRQRCMQQR